MFLDAAHGVIGRSHVLELLSRVWCRHIGGPIYIQPISTQGASHGVITSHSALWEDKDKARPFTLGPSLDPDSRFTLWLLGVTFTLIMCFAVPYFHGRYILSV